MNFDVNYADTSLETIEFISNGSKANFLSRSTPVISSISLDTPFHTNELWEDGYMKFLEIAQYFSKKNFSVIPLADNFEAPEILQKYLSVSARFDLGSIEQAMKGFPNVGIMTGKTSMNLFTVRCETQQSYIRMEANLGDYAKWVSKTRDYWDIWFLCGSGVLKNSNYSLGVKLLGQMTIIVAPGSYSDTGDMSEWVSRVGDFPPVLFTEEMEDLLPDTKTIAMSPKLDNTFSIEPSHGKDLRSTKEVIVDYSHLLGPEIMSINGRSRVGMVSVFNALMHRATLENISKFRATSREVDQLSGVSRKSVEKYIRRWIQLGFFSLLSQNKLGNIYCLCEKPGFYPITELGNNGVRTRIFPNHDVWSARGLGNHGKMVAEVLFNSKTELSAVAIANNTKICVDTVRGKLKKMQDLSLVSKRHTKWEIIQPALTSDNLDQCAEILRVKGNLYKKNSQRQKERMNYAIYLLRRLSPGPTNVQQE